MEAQQELVTHLDGPPPWVERSCLQTVWSQRLQRSQGKVCMMSRPGRRTLLGRHAAAEELFHGAQLMPASLQEAQILERQAWWGLWARC